jgi:uncharacterized protein (TIGR02145 family)
MKKVISILIIVLLTVCVTNAQEMIRSIKAGEWEKTLEEDVPYILEPNANSVVIKQGETYLHFFALPGSLIFTSKEVDYVVINGVKWAKYNVNTPGTFTSQPHEAGMFYQWNRKIGWSSTDPMVNSNGGTTWDASIPTGNSWDMANNPCPSGWRLPTEAQLQGLINSGNSWEQLNGVWGRFFGSGDQRVFLPAAGYRLGAAGLLDAEGIYGNYWSGTPSSSEFACNLLFRSENAGTNVFFRRGGLSVRCIKD